MLWCVCSAASAGQISFNDALSSQQWYLGRMNFGGAWSELYNQAQRGVVRVATIDSGWDVDHRDLTGNLLPGYNIVDGSGNVGPIHPHGTATVGPLGASSGNGLGISRAAWTSEVLPIRVTNREDGAAYASHIAQAIRYAADHKSRVISISYSGAELYGIAEAAHYAAKRGAVVFMAAGNDGLAHRNWTNHNWIVAVGSTDENDHVSSFSSRGAFVDFVAPGENILTLGTGDRYGRWSGTSLSSPLAASAAALMLAVNPRLAAGQVIRLLRRTAVDLGVAGFDEESGYGRINAGAAVRAALATEGFWTEKRARRAMAIVDNDWSEFEGIVATQAFMDDFLSASAGLTVAGSAAVVPEPTTAALLGLPVLLLMSRPRRRWRDFV
jgi:subtilisin family serine protease